MTQRITIRGIIVKNGRLFAQKLKSRDGGEKDFWCTPGGGLEEGESIHVGLEREMIEETGVAPEIGKLLYVQQYTEEDGREFLEFFFHIINADDYKSVDLTATSHGELEVARNEFIDPRKENILPKFLSEVDYSNIASQDMTKFFEYLQK